MDISKLDVVKLSNEGYRCVIKNPKTGDDTDLVIIIKGTYSEGFREACEAADTVGKTAEMLAKFTLGWENLAENGKKVKFTVEEAARVYQQYPLIRGQLLTAAMDVRNFIKD